MSIRLLPIYGHFIETISRNEEIRRRRNVVFRTKTLANDAEHWNNRRKFTHQLWNTINRETRSSILIRAHFSLSSMDCKIISNLTFDEGRLLKGARGVKISKRKKRKTPIIYSVGFLRDIFHWMLPVSCSIARKKHFCFHVLEYEMQIKINHAVSGNYRM
jgi:hypothetical protein